MTTTVRAGIMLAVLVGGPAAWMYYGPLPDSAQRVVNRFVATAKDAVEWDKHFGPSRQAATRAQVGTPAPRSLTAEASAPAPAGARSLAQQAEPLLSQLRQLGVAEYALEPWGADRRLFRFRCEMPVAGGGQSTEQFEAIAADPRASIEQVVADVSKWHSARFASQ